MPRKYDHLHTPEVAAKISIAMRGNVNGRRGRGRKKPGCREAGVRNLIERGVPARMASPIAGPFATNIHAIRYALISPDETKYEGSNLALFVREHSELFDETDVAEEVLRGGSTTCRAYRKLGQMLREEHRKSWKGWRKG